MTQPVPNLNARLVDVMGKIIPPWNSFFQQLVQPAPDAVSVGLSPFTANAKGTLFISGVAPSLILSRGTTVINLTGQRVIPISIGDTITFTGTPTLQFLGA